MRARACGLQLDEPRHKTGAPPLDPRADYQTSIDAYQACVNSNLNNVDACEEKRVQMETIEHAYRGR